MAQVSLLIIYQQTMKATAFLPQQMVQAAGWLRLNLQAEQQPTWTSAVALAIVPLPLFKGKTGCDRPSIGFCIEFLLDSKYDGLPLAIKVKLAKPLTVR
jgi:hypothetical protein